MIRLRIDEILREKGITNKTQFANRLGMSRNGFAKIILHGIDRIELATIEKLCKELNVTPNDLFEITEGSIGVINKIDGDEVRKKNEGSPLCDERRGLFFI